MIKGSSRQPVAFGANAQTFTKKGNYGVLVALTPKGKQLVQQVHAANHSKHPKHEVIVVTLTVTYTPTGGTARSHTYKGIAIRP